MHKKVVLRHPGRPYDPSLCQRGEDLRPLFFKRAFSKRPYAEIIY